MDGPTFVADYVTGESVVSDPIFHIYRSSHTEDELQNYMDTNESRVATLVASDGPGFAGDALLDDIEVSVKRNKTHWSIEDIPAPPGDTAPTSEELTLVTLTEADAPLSHRCPLGLEAICRLLCTELGMYCPECTDDIDNDDDGWVDYPNDSGCYSKWDDSELTTREEMTYGVFGEGKWCTYAGEEDWEEEIKDAYEQIDEGFDNNGGVIPDLEWESSTIRCWFFESTDDAEHCDQNGGCGVKGSDEDYPYNGCDSQASCYRDNAWTDVEVRRDTGAEIPGLKVIHIVHEGVMGDLCGLSEWPPGGASVAIGPDDIAGTGCEDYVSTHEVGHNFDATHGDARPDDQVGCDTVMEQSADTNCRKNYFSDPNRNNIDDCVGLHNDCPRSGTG